MKMTCVWTVGLILIVINVVVGQDHVGILHGIDVESKQTGDYCIMYNPQFLELPSVLEDAVMYEVANLSTWLMCNDSVVDPELLQDKAAFVARGNCTFSEKAFQVQHYGAEALIVISRAGLTEPAANNPDDYNKINISVSLLSQEHFEDLMALGPAVRVQIYAPPPARIDWNLIVIWLLATGTVCAGAFWSGIAKHKQYMRKRRPSSRQVQQTDSESEGARDDRDDENFDMSPTTVIIFVVLMCALLLSLYFFYDYLVYVVIAMFALASCTALYATLKPLLVRIPLIGDCQVPPNKIPGFRRRPEIRRIVLFLMCAGVAIWWGIVRNESYAWILQDILGIVFCVHMMKTIRMPSLMTCCILLGLLFVYDVFFVFITPLFTKSGQSVMVDVATGGESKSGEMLPMVLKVPRITRSVFSTCQLPFSLLGFGDIIIPGLLVSYCHGFDLKVNSKRVYFISTLIAYGVGLVLTFVALAVMEEGQPALLYLVPCTVLTALLVAACRRELAHIWHGKLTLSSAEAKDQAAPALATNGSAASDDQSRAQSETRSTADSEVVSEDSDCEQPLLIK